MNEKDLEIYEKVRSGQTGYLEQKRGLIAVWGKEAVQFLNGLITNDVAKMEDGDQMLAAFPNAQGRLLAVVRVMRTGEKFLFETEDATHEKVHQNLFRFTFAGDFFVEDISENYRFFEVFNFELQAPSSIIKFQGTGGTTWAVPDGDLKTFFHNISDLPNEKISDEVYDTLRIENGLPLYGIDMDESTIVPELGLDGLISYSKGCYIGQEIIARIHFRGHVAKQLTGIISSEPVAADGDRNELKTLDGKNAGRVTSTTYSPSLDRIISLAFVRYDYLSEGTELVAGEVPVKVSGLPFVK